DGGVRARERGAAAVVVVPGELELQGVLDDLVRAPPEVGERHLLRRPPRDELLDIAVERVRDGSERRQGLPLAIPLLEEGRSRSIAGWRPRSRPLGRRSRCRSPRTRRTRRRASRTA